jgi:hypothetical protein
MLFGRGRDPADAAVLGCGVEELLLPPEPEKVAKPMAATEEPSAASC